MHTEWGEDSSFLIGSPHSGKNDSPLFVTSKKNGGAKAISTAAMRRKSLRQLLAQRPLFSNKSWLNVLRLAPMNGSKIVIVWDTLCCFR